MFKSSGRLQNDDKMNEEHFELQHKMCSITNLKVK